MKITEKDIGRKVIVNSINSGTINFNSQIGILKAIDDSFQCEYGISFDNCIDIGHNLGGLCDYGYGYWVYKEDITFISPPHEFLEYFKNKNVVVNCETEQEAEWFCEWMKEDPKRNWSYSWDQYKKNTCFTYPKRENWYSLFSSKAFYKEEDYEIIKWKDLMNWKEDDIEEIFEVGDEVELTMTYYDDIPHKGNYTKYKRGDRFIIKGIGSSSLEEAGQGWLCDETGYGVYASICKIVRKAKDIKKEEKKEMEYKVVRSFTLKDIIEKDPCDGEFRKLIKEILDKEYYKDIFTFEGRITKEFTEDNWMEYETLQNNLDWLEDNGFIEKVKTFKAFDLTFRIESEDELLDIYHRMNCGYLSIQKGSTEQTFKFSEKDHGIKLWRTVNKEMYRIKD